MAQYTRRGWIKPAMVIFGSQLAYAEQVDKKKNQGAPCGESIVRLDENCGIRIGSNCRPQNGSHCLTYIGPQCEEDRMGQPCV